MLKRLAAKLGGKRDLRSGRSDYKGTWQGLSQTERDAKMFVAGYTDERRFQLAAESTLALLESFIGIRQTDVVLEIGCGVGRVGRVVAPRCAEWIGCDISANMLGHAARRLADLPNVRFVELSSVGLEEIPDASVDVVYCTVVFMHLYEWDRFTYVEEAYRTLRPGGRCFFDNMDIASEGGWRYFSESRSHPLAHRPPQIGMTSSGDELRTYAERAGFEDVELHRWHGAWVGVTGVKPSGPRQAESRRRASRARYVTDAPSPEALITLFEGEWVSKLPAPFAHLRAGDTPLFEDDRIRWCERTIGGFAGKRVLELGPLEGGHTAMIERGGAAAVVAVEQDIRAYLRCLVVKELLGLQRSSFLCGDFMEYLAVTPDRFDLAIASGVLYESPSPVELVSLLARVADAVFVWTHYYDAKMTGGNFGPGIEAETAGFRCRLFKHDHGEAADGPRFCGGAAGYGHWMTRADILACFEHFGFSRIETGCDDPDHPNGPALAFVAWKTA
jgi:SAM-dependent methyltransferase